MAMVVEALAKLGYNPSAGFIHELEKACVSRGFRDYEGKALKGLLGGLIQIGRPGRVFMMGFINACCDRLSPAKRKQFRGRDLVDIIQCLNIISGDYPNPKPLFFRLVEDYCMDTPTPQWEQFTTQHLMAIIKAFARCRHIPHAPFWERLEGALDVSTLTSNGVKRVVDAMEQLGHQPSPTLIRLSSSSNSGGNSSSESMPSISIPPISQSSPPPQEAAPVSPDDGNDGDGGDDGCFIVHRVNTEEPVSRRIG